jgi:excisionase family DNA binding protein
MKAHTHSHPISELSSLVQSENGLARQQWLSLKDASEFLGVHFTTLRAWADSGELRVFRTPGGHRRFSLRDLRRFLEERASRAISPSEVALVDAAVSLVRKELQNLSQAQIDWASSADEVTTNLRRRRGRQLFALAISYVLKPTQRGRLLEEGRRLGYEYGLEARANKLALAATGRAVRFFRTQLVASVRNQESPEQLDADDLWIQELIDQFLDEVLYAVLDGYEQGGLSVVGETSGSRSF